MGFYHQWKRRTETTRKGYGKIVKYINVGFNTERDYYVLINEEGHFLAEDIDYNKLHKMLYEMK